MSKNNKDFHSTTVLVIQKDGETCIVADGQATLGSTVAKSHVKKVRVINGDSTNPIFVGYAGSVSEALMLLEIFEAKLKKSSGELNKAALDLAKDWVSNKIYRGFEAELLVADKDNIITIAGGGNVIQGEDGIMSIGSGSLFASSAAKAYMDIGKDLTAEEIAMRSMKIATDTCIYTNGNYTKFVMKNGKLVK